LGQLSAFFFFLAAACKTHREGRNGPFGRPRVLRRNVKLGFALIDQGDVGFDKVLAAGEPAAAETRLGPFGPGEGDP
jgi:hypothetical protein